MVVLDSIKVENLDFSDIGYWTLFLRKPFFFFLYRCNLFDRPKTSVIVLKKL